MLPQVARTPLSASKRAPTIARCVKVIVCQLFEIPSRSRSTSQHNTLQCAEMKAFNCMRHNRNRRGAVEKQGAWLLSFGMPPPLPLPSTEPAEPPPSSPVCTNNGFEGNFQLATCNLPHHYPITLSSRSFVRRSAANSQQPATEHRRASIAHRGRIESSLAGNRAQIIVLHCARSIR
ncbi:unnamed protein product [Ceratitis capitata]|uniref:(Mediterranean fruit fly) hypothetical protein n=1 Tax=Ceratitis capitata TaxID=7213 RepID=A0A811UTM3_CERCA|nr:unnamed protein product [Ceratitis capitata]